MSTSLGGLHLKPPKFEHICNCHNFSALSSVQILLIPACCLLCVLYDDMKRSLYAPFLIRYIQTQGSLKKLHFLLRGRPRNICDPTSSNPCNSGMLHVIFFFLSLNITATWFSNPQIFWGLSLKAPWSYVCGRLGSAFF